MEEGRSVANDFFEIAPLHVKELRTEQLQKSPILVPSCESRVSTWSGQRFALVSVDLAEFSILYQTPLTVTFIGYRPDGSTVMTEFVTDGIIDGSGPLADFQTFNFDSRFADLVRVEIPTYGWSLDNMMFSQVPEPAAVALLVVGGLLFWALRTCLGRIRPVEETAEYAKHAEGLVIQPPSPVPDD